MKFYMHTMDGNPAAFCEDQIYYWWGGANLAKSLRQIRREQQASVYFRRSHGWDVPRYDYILIKIKEAKQ